MSVEEYNRVAKKGPHIRGTRKKQVNGLMFDSTKEARRYQDLALMQDAGQIKGLKRQVPFPIIINDRRVCEWRADFVYFDGRENRLMVEDTKGFRTDYYKLKKRLVEAYHNIEILET